MLLLTTTTEHSQEDTGKYKYFFLREDNPGKFKKISSRLHVAYEEACRGATHARCTCLLARHARTAC